MAQMGDELHIPRRCKQHSQGGTDDLPAHNNSQYADRTYPDGGTEKLDVDALIVLGAKRRVHDYRVEEAMPASVPRGLL